MIYKFYVQGESRALVLRHHFNARAPEPGGPWRVQARALVHVCHQIRDEYRPIYFANVEVTIAWHFLTRFLETHFNTEATRWNPPKKMIVCVGPTWEDNRNLRSMRVTVDILPLLRMKEVRPSFDCNFRDISGSYKRQSNQRVREACTVHELNGFIAAGLKWAWSETWEENIRNNASQLLVTRYSTADEGRRKWLELELRSSDAQMVYSRTRENTATKTFYRKTVNVV